MARFLLEDGQGSSHGSDRNDTLSGGAYLGIGLSCGFVIGIITYAVIHWWIRSRMNAVPNSQVRPSAQRGSTGGFSNIGQDIRTAPSTNNLLAAPLPPPKQTSTDMFFSPLQSSIAKSTNVRGSTNSVALPDPATYGSHGIALLHVNQPAAPHVAAQPQPIPLQMAPRATPDDVSPAMPPATPSADVMTPATQPIQSQPSGRDTAADQSAQPRQQHQRMVSVADAYGADDLDDEWAVVLGDLDGLLAKKGEPRLASPERAVAVRRLIAVTGSRGMQHALEAAMQDVIRYRTRK